MLPEAELRRVLVTLPRMVLHGPWSRAIAFNLLHQPPVDVSPAGVPLPLWPGGPARLGARFTPPGGYDSIYLASDVNTAMAEIQGLLQPSTGPIILTDLRPWTLITIDGVLTEVIDLSNVGVQRSLGTSLQELSGHW